MFASDAMFQIAVSILGLMAKTQDRTRSVRRWLLKKDDDLLEIILLGFGW